MGCAESPAAHNGRLGLRLGWVGEMSIGRFRSAIQPSEFMDGVCSPHINRHALLALRNWQVMRFSLDISPCEQRYHHQVAEPRKWLKRKESNGF